VPPEVSVFYRYLLASALLFAFCAARGLPLRYRLREHLWLAALGVAMFGVSYVLVYYAEVYVVSGLVAVGYSASPLFGMLGQRMCFGTPMTDHLPKGGPLWARPEAVAQRIRKAADGKAPVVYVPGFWRLILLVIRLLPASIFHRRPL